MINVANVIWRKAVKEVDIKGMLFKKRNQCPKGFVQKICIYLQLIHFNYSKYVGYLIPKDWCVASFTSIHLDGMNYENPLEFDHGDGR